MNSEEIAALEAQHATGVVPQKPFAIQRGEGTRLFTPEGRAVLDFGASYGVVAIGHQHPLVVAAMRDQLAQLTFVHSVYPNEVRARLQAALCKAAKLPRVFLTNSGTEAIEGALKFSIASTSRRGLVAVKGAFHGRTMGSLTLTWRRDYREPFEPLLPGVAHVEPDPSALDAAITEETACFVAEPVQGEGGVRPLPAEFLRAAKKRCDEVGAFFVADEIQTGLGRTGKLFAHEHAGVRPDLVCVGKALGNGYPVGAVLMREEATRVPTLSHGGTYNGSPLACAAALATLLVIREQRLWVRAEEMGSYFRERLAAEKYESIRETRGLGLMLGVDLRVKNTQILKSMLDQGIAALGAGPTVVRFLPPLTVSREEIDAAVDAFARSLAAEGGAP
ncbi:MAG: aspartate aminotransferase family protein [Methanobacteriota archaeon]